MVYRIVTAAQMHLAEGDAVVLQWALRILYFLALHADGSCAALTYALPLGGLLSKLVASGCCELLGQGLRAHPTHFMVAAWAARCTHALAVS
eukprot:gene59138-80980_t